MSVIDEMQDLTTKQSLRLAMQRAMEAQMVRLVEVWSGNVGQVGETEAYENFARGLAKVANARIVMMKLIDELDI